MSMQLAYETYPASGVPPEMEITEGALQPAAAELTDDPMQLSVQDLAVMNLIKRYDGAGIPVTEVDEKIRRSYPPGYSNPQIGQIRRNILNRISTAFPGSLYRSGGARNRHLHWRDGSEVGTEPEAGLQVISAKSFALGALLTDINRGNSQYEPKILETLGLQPPEDGWTRKALCSDEVLVPDPEAFFPEETDVASAKPASDICKQCKVGWDCLAYALATREEHGVWGGMTPRQRRKILKIAGFGPSDKKKDKEQDASAGNDQSVVEVETEAV